MIDEYVDFCNKKGAFMSTFTDKKKIMIRARVTKFVQFSIILSLKMVDDQISVSKKL